MRYPIKVNAIPVVTEQHSCMKRYKLFHACGGVVYILYDPNKQGREWAQRIGLDYLYKSKNA